MKVLLNIESYGKEKEGKKNLTAGVTRMWGNDKIYFVQLVLIITADGNIKKYIYNNNYRQQFLQNKKKLLTAVKF